MIADAQGFFQASLVARLVKNSPAMQETPVQLLGRDDPLEKGWATHSRILGLPCGSADKETTCNEGDLGWIPGLRRSPGAVACEILLDQGSNP